MKRKIHSNSIEAYKKIKKQAQSRKARLIATIKRFPGKTCVWYAKKMKVYPNVISGRFGELRDAGVLRSIGKVKLNSNRLMDTWEVAA
jgi:hypothetical protein